MITRKRIKSAEALLVFFIKNLPADQLGLAGEAIINTEISRLCKGRILKVWTERMERVNEEWLGVSGQSISPRVIDKLKK